MNLATEFLVKSIVATFGAGVLCLGLPAMVMTAIDTQNAAAPAPVEQVAPSYPGQVMN